MKLRAKWFGPLPSVGEYLMSQKRPRGAYRIVAIDNPRGLDTAVPIDLYGDPTHTLVFECERIEVAAVPKGATVHNWTWSSRSRKPVVWK